MFGVGSSFSGRSVLCLLALLAILLRGMVADGYMLARSVDDPGPIRVTLCNGGHYEFASKTITLGVKQQAPGENNGADHEGKPFGGCAFALSSVLVPPVTLFDVIVFQVLSSVQPSVRAYMRPGLGLSAPPPPARGPPITF